MVNHLSEYAERINGLILARWHRRKANNELEEIGLCYAKLKEEYRIIDTNYKALFKAQCYYELEISDFVNTEKLFMILGTQNSYNLKYFYVSIIHKFDLEDNKLSYYDNTPIVYIFNIIPHEKPKFFQLTDRGFKDKTGFYTILNESAGFSDDFFDKIFSVDMSSYIVGKEKDINALRIKTRA